MFLPELCFRFFSASLRSLYYTLLYTGEYMGGVYTIAIWDVYVNVKVIRTHVLVQHRGGVVPPLTRTIGVPMTRNAQRVQGKSGSFPVGEATRTGHGFPSGTSSSHFSTMKNSS